ncbi:MAG: GAF domain-containing protein [Anaerolineales bacterium]|nr:MAG: GAF domain-containing protein [Anaerolineales bacterium]
MALVIQSGAKPHRIHVKSWVPSIIMLMSDNDLRDLLVQQSEGILSLGGARMALVDVEAGFWGIRRQIEALIGPGLTNSVFQQAGANGGASFAQTFTSAENLSGATAFSACLQVYQQAGFGHFEMTTIDWPIGRICIRADQAFEAWMISQHNQHCTAPCCAYTAGVLVGFVNIITGRNDVVCIEHTCQSQGDAFCQFELLPAADARDQTVVALLPDPGIGLRLNLLEMLFERMPMGIAIIDRDYRVQRYNPTWADYTHRYASSLGARLVPGVYYFDHMPGTESTVKPLYDRALSGETVRQNSVRLDSKDIITYWDVVLTPLVEKGEVVGLLTVSVDATERVAAQQNLEQRVEERTRELQMLLDVAATANSSLDLDETLMKTLDLLVELIDASRAGVGLIDEDTGQLRLNILRPERTVHPADAGRMLQAGRMVIDSGEILSIEADISQGLLEPGVLLPLQVRDKRLGILGIIGQKGGAFTPAQLNLFKSIADQLGIAIENAQLFEKAEAAAIAAERNRLARDLHDAVTQTLFSASMIADVLPIIWDKNHDQGMLRLEELRQLTRGALSEMRTLLVELRPAALVDTDLGDLIGHQVNAFIARTRIQVKYERNCAQNPPTIVKEMLYRVAQEALSNIAKHAEAKTVWIKLDSQTGKTELVIQDDGVGFDLDSAKSYGLGLGIMAERAHHVGAQFNIRSQIHDGTRLQVIWQEPNDKEHNDD